MIRPSARSSFALFRVDDRLLHGQVALGWGRHLGPTDYLLADDSLASDPDGAELYALSAPEEARVEVIRPRDLARLWKDGPPGGAGLLEPSRTVLLVRGLPQAGELLRSGITGPLNLGGLHLRAGAVEILPYLFLTPDDRVLLRDLLDEGHDVFAQDLPGHSRRSGREIVEHPAWDRRP